MDYFFIGGEAEHYFLGMGGMQSLSTQGEMVGRLRCYYRRKKY